MADTREDVQEGIRAYEYLNEVENVDFIISGCIDDVSLGWLERMAEFRTPTLDTWTSYVGIIDKVVEEYDKYKMYFMNVSNDYALAILYVDFGKDVLSKQMGWKTVYVLQEGHRVRRRRLRADRAGSLAGSRYRDRRSHRLRHQHGRLRPDLQQGGGGGNPTSST